MIRDQAIRERAAEWQLRLDVVEKDYVLGWLLAVVAEHPETSQQWVFKGGTCLKKCFFETYRFSEDLDFSMLPGAKYTSGELLETLREVAARAAELSGIEFPPEAVAVRERKNKQDGVIFEGSIGYRGPMGIPSVPRVRFDLTRQEPLLDGVDRRGVFHAYPDSLPMDLLVATYTIDELFAEKLRALAERTRPRDLYDVVFMLENRPHALNLIRSRELFREKCRVKNLTVLDSAALLALIHGNEELRSEWANMLAHQLPQLPPLESILERIAGLLGWLDGPQAVPVVALGAAPSPEGQELVVSAGLQYWGSGIRLEAARFAGANRLLIEFIYHGERRLIEPYSLRRAGTGNVLLYGWELESDQIKAFKASEIRELRATTTPFTPRFRVEFTAAGPLTAQPFRSRPSRAPGPGPVARPRQSPSSVVYVYQCPRCGREFEHSSRDSTLRSHKLPGGYGQCAGRRGNFVTTRYG